MAREPHDSQGAGSCTPNSEVLFVAQKKRRHHYVWQHYLAAWATDGQVWCLREGRRFSTNTINIAQRRDFYRLKEMTARDLEYVDRLIIQPSAPHLQKIAKGWIPHFTELFEIRRTYESGDLNLPEFESALDTSINNLEEDMHADIEIRGLPILVALRNGDASILDDPQQFVHFCWFVSTQYMRTPKLKARAVASMSSIRDFDVDASWGLIRTIFSANIGASLNDRRATLRIEFLDAWPDTEFITADQPLVNTCAVGLPDNVGPDKLEYYYPLSPRLAVLLDFDHESPGTGRRSLTPDEVADYNQMLIDEAVEQIYAANEAILMDSGNHETD